jgi:hypothetical protein
MKTNQILLLAAVAIGAYYFAKTKNPSGNSNGNGGGAVPVTPASTSLDLFTPGVAGPYAPHHMRSRAISKLSRSVHTVL